MAIHDKRENRPCLAIPNRREAKFLQERTQQSLHRWAITEAWCRTCLPARLDTRSRPRVAKLVGEKFHTAPLITLRSVWLQKSPLMVANKPSLPSSDSYRVTG